MTARNLVVLAAGGTGGHMFPAEALAGELLARGHHLALVTDKRGATLGGVTMGGAFDTTKNGNSGKIERHTIRAATLGGGLAKAAGGLMNIAAGTLQARSLLKRLRPQVVVGFGGYPSLPTMMAAPRLRVPAAVHEQNARLGRVNRFVANRMNAIALSFEDTDGVPSDRAAVSVTGNPVRDSIVALRSQGYTPPDADGDIRILITGGSQGAEIFSDVVPMALGGLPLEIRKRLRVTQQCRENTLSRVRDMYAEHDIAAELAPFIENVADCLGAAHLVICRAGASTVAELTVAGRPAILVPYPHARDDHQTANADQLDKANAGWRIAQPEFTAEALRAQLLTLFDQPEKLSDAASNAAALGRPDAAARLADLVETLFVGAQQGRAA